MQTTKPAPDDANGYQRKRPAELELEKERGPAKLSCSNPTTTNSSILQILKQHPPGIAVAASAYARTTPETNNNGVSQVNRIMMTAEAIRLKYGIDIQLPQEQIFLEKENTCRQKGEESEALHQLMSHLYYFTCSNPGTTMIVIVTDVKRVGDTKRHIAFLEAMVKRISDNIHLFCLDSAIIGHQFVAAEKEDCTKALMAVQEKYSHYNAGKNVPATEVGQAVQKEVDAMRKLLIDVIRDSKGLYNGKQFKRYHDIVDKISDACLLGNEMCFRLQSLISKADEVLTDVLERVNLPNDAAGKITPWQAAKELCMYMPDITSFLEHVVARHKSCMGLAETDIVTLLVGYVRLSPLWHTCYDATHQLTSNEAATQVGGGGDVSNLLRINISDIGKSRETVGNPGFLVFLMLTCTAMVDSNVVPEPVRLNSDKQLIAIIDCLNVYTSTHLMFSRAIGKDIMALADAEVSRKDERAEAHERCENNIKVRAKMLTVEEKEFYEGSKMIGGTRMTNGEIRK